MSNNNLNNPSIVLFYVEWCGFCTEFMPIWEKLTELVKNKKINIYKRSCVQHNDYCKKLDRLQGYPTIYYVPVDGPVIEFKEERTLENLIEFINNNN